MYVYIYIYIYIYIICKTLRYINNFLSLLLSYSFNLFNTLFLTSKSFLINCQKNNLRVPFVRSFCSDIIPIVLKHWLLLMFVTKKMKHKVHF